VTGGWYLPLVRRSQYSLAGTFHRRRSGLLKIGFFRHVRELKIQGKIQGVLCVSSFLQNDAAENVGKSVSILPRSSKSRKLSKKLPILIVKFSLVFFLL
jgi:hypothetical protein